LFWQLLYIKNSICRTSLRQSFDAKIYFFKGYSHSFEINMNLKGNTSAKGTLFELATPQTTKLELAPFFYLGVVRPNKFVKIPTVTTGQKQTNSWLYQKTSPGTFGDWWQPMTIQYHGKVGFRYRWHQVADASFAIGDQKWIRSPTNANDAYRCSLMVSQW